MPSVFVFLAVISFAYAAENRCQKAVGPNPPSIGKRSVCGTGCSTDSDCETGAKCCAHNSEPSCHKVCTPTTEICGGCRGNPLSTEPACSHRVSYSCQKTRYTDCGFWYWSTCTRYYYSQCYKNRLYCCDNFKLEGQTCKRWLDWSEWSSCSATCGMCGTQTRTRCTSRSCSNPSSESRKCDTTPCPGIISRYASRCSRRTTTGWWWSNSSVTKYYTCYKQSKCCSGYKDSNNVCVGA